MVFLPTVLSAPSLWALRQKLPGLSQALADRQSVAFSHSHCKGSQYPPAPLGFRSGFQLMLLHSPCVESFAGGVPNYRVRSSGSSCVPIPLHPGFSPTRRQRNYMVPPRAVPSLPGPVTHPAPLTSPYHQGHRQHPMPGDWDKRGQTQPLVRRAKEAHLPGILAGQAQPASRRRRCLCVQSRPNLASSDLWAARR